MTLEGTLSEAVNQVMTLKQKFMAAIHRCGCVGICPSCEDDIRFLCKDNGQDAEHLILTMRENKTGRPTKK
jgi:hypothetical protein